VDAAADVCGRRIASARQKLTPKLPGGIIRQKMDGRAVLILSIGKLDRVDVRLE
jgi:hypothetical protein